jgi:glycosyltransferase involved in cell wall biosynthesis
VSGSDDLPGPAGRVVVFGTYDSKAHPRAQVIVDGLRANGIDVEECNATLGFDTAARVAFLAQPWKAPLLVVRIAGRWRELWRRGARLDPADAVVVPYLGHFDVHLARRRFRRTPIVLDHMISGRDTARDRGLGGPVREQLLNRIDHAALRAADIVMVDTDEHREFLPHWARGKAVVVPVGAPDSWQAPPRPAYDGSRPLKVIFFGLFTPLQGAITIGRALGQLADDERITVTMVGAGQQLEETRRSASANPRVTWTGLVEPDSLPALTADHDVCLGIFADNPKGLRVVPNKVYQGMRAGCAVVTSDTAPQRRALGEAARFVPPADPDALAAALRALAAHPDQVASLQAASRAASERFAPAEVVRDLAVRLGRPPSAPPASADVPSPASAAEDGSARAFQADRRRALIGFSVIVLALLGAALAIYRERHTVGPTLRHIGPGPTALAIVCGLVAVGANYPTWWNILAGYQVRLPGSAGARLWFTTQLGKYLPGSVWPAVMQMEGGRRHGASRKTMLAANLLTIVVTCATGLVIAAATLPFSDRHAATKYWWGVLFVPPLIAVLYPKVLAWLFEKASALVRRPSSIALIDGRHEAQAAAWTVVYWLAIGMQTSVLAATVTGWSFWTVALSMGAMALAVPLGVLFIPAPAGAGIREVVLALILSSTMPAGRAVAVVIASRVISTVCDLLAAAGAALLPKRKGVSREDGAGERTRTSTPLGTRT